MCAQVTLLGLEPTADELAEALQQYGVDVVFSEDPTGQFWILVMQVCSERARLCLSLNRD